jgi:hypothetical protein
MTQKTSRSTSGSNGSSPVSNFLNRLTNSNQNSQSQQPNAANPLGQNNNLPQRPSFGTRNHQVYTLQPLHGMVARFELKGLGDPFYRLFGQEPNPDCGSLPTLISILERGGESIDALKTLLDEQWKGYRLRGAFLVYKWNSQHWKALTAPPEAPVKPPAETEDQEDENPLQTPPTPKMAKFQCLRAIDLGLVINVLARSRSQTLLTQTPLMFSQSTLERSIMSDDPRLIGLVKATGYLTEGE